MSWAPSPGPCAFSLPTSGRQGTRAVPPLSSLRPLRLPASAPCPGLLLLVGLTESTPLHGAVLWSGLLCAQRAAWCDSQDPPLNECPRPVPTAPPPTSAPGPSPYLLGPLCSMSTCCGPGVSQALAHSIFNVLSEGALHASICFYNGGNRAWRLRVGAGPTCLSRRLC